MKEFFQSSNSYSNTILNGGSFGWAL